MKDGKAIPSLALEWSNIDDCKIIVKLNKDILWSDGKKLTSEDVKFTIKLLKNELDNSIYKANVENIEKVEIIDEYTLKMYLKQKDDFFEYNLNFPIIAGHSYNENEIPLGTGKYKISFVSNDLVVLKQNENSWGGIQNNIETIEIKLYENLGYAYNDFKNSKIDLINLEGYNWQEKIGKIGYEYQEYIGRDLEFLAFNCKNRGLENINIRKKIAKTINKEQINNEVYNGNKFLADFILPSNNWLYTENVFISSSAEQNINKEEIKIEQTLSLIVNKDNEKRCEMAFTIAEQIKKTGIKINVQELTYNEYIKRINNKNFDIALMGITTFFSPDISLFFGEDNYANYINDEITQLLEDTNNLEENYKKIQEIFIEEYPYIPLFFEKNIVAYRNINGIISPRWNDLFFKFDMWEME